MKFPTTIHIGRQIGTMLVFSIFLVLARVVLFGSSDFLYLPWNLFLAFLPFAISGILLWYRKNSRLSPAILVVGLALWLLLFPNAPYLVTDILHLNHTRQISFWYDIVLLFTYAWAGMLLALTSLSHIESILRTRYSKRVSQVLLGTMILLASFGMYIGRFLRFNSWDVLVAPGSLLRIIWDIVVHPLSHAGAYIFTGIFFVFITVAYFAWKGDRVVY